MRTWQPELKENLVQIPAVEGGFSLVLCKLSKKGHNPHVDLDLFFLYKLSSVIVTNLQV